MTENRGGVGWDTAEGNMQAGQTKWDTRKLLGMMNIFITVIVVILRGSIHMSKHQIVHFKYVQLTECQLYLNNTVKIL